MAIDRTRDERIVENGRVVDDRRVVERERPSSGMGWLVAILVIVALVVAAFAFGLIDIDQTRSAKLPKVETSGGQAPAFDVDTAKIDIGKKEETLKVPTVDVGSKDTTVTMPTIDVDRADNPNKKD